MAEATLSLSELRESLSSADAVRVRPFALLKELCRLVGGAAGSSDETIAQELVLRALEHRAEFGACRPVLDGLVRELGLFPYLSGEELSVADQIAYECHRPHNLDDSVVFHHPQARVYHALISGRSVVLSAPTSFGKSLIIDAVIASGKYKNIVVVVPTIALIDETRRRLSRFRDAYKIITHAFQAPGEANIFVLTQERVLDHPSIEHVDFFVIDEFYKLSPTTSGDEERCALLNQAFYALAKRCKHFYLLGPGIQQISEDFRRRLSFEFIHEPYNTVVSDLHSVPRGGSREDRLRRLCQQLDGPTIVFCKSPDSARDVAAELASVTGTTGSFAEAADWIGTKYHPDWHFVKALRSGIGIHHGRIPRALAQYTVRAFNAERLPFLVCTSTLIEGVNTKAKNIIVYDHTINRQALDLFTFNNIRGRSGRMFQHFVGHVYIFEPPPQEGLPFVDVPAFTQGDNAPDRLLLQIDEDDLSTDASERLRPYREQSVLSMDILRANAGVDPRLQLELAQKIQASPRRYWPSLRWSGTPTWEQLKAVCELIWEHFDGRRLGAGSARSHAQLAVMIRKLQARPTEAEMITGQLPYAKGDADAAVQRVLDFQRLWATFHFPKLLRALGRIQGEVLTRAGLSAGNYDAYASRVEHLFMDPSLVALEEYGVPLPLARKLEHSLQPNKDLDAILTRLRGLRLGMLRLTAFEKEILEDAQEYA